MLFKGTLAWALVFHLANGPSLPFAAAVALAFLLSDN